MATNTRSQQPQAEGISGVILQDLELLRWRDLHTSTHPAPSRRPQPPGSCLRVLRCVAYCALSLDSPAPSPIGQNGHLGHCGPMRRSGGRATLRRRQHPFRTHICRPLKLPFADFGLISPRYFEGTPSGTLFGDLQVSPRRRLTPTTVGRASPSLTALPRQMVRNLLCNIFRYYLEFPYLTLRHRGSVPDRAG